MKSSTLPIIEDIADVVAYNGINDTTILEIEVIINDSTITDKTTAIAKAIGALNDNIVQIRRVMKEYNLE